MKCTYRAQRCGVRRLALLVLLAVAVAPAFAGAEDAEKADALRPGMTLDQSTAHLAADLLPPEILAHYQKGEYINEIVAWPEDEYTWPTDFLAASKANAGKYEVAPEGHVVEKSTGKQPPYILGFPFPEVDEKDPRAGAKIVWNYFYRTWYFGNLFAQSQFNFMNPDGMERRLDVEASFMYYDGVPARERPEYNPQNFINKFLSLVKQPADLQGTASLTWRYRDPGKRDSTWSYVPALRRVRQVSPANRSDGFLGSDFAQDDGNFFDGKAEEFTWKLIDKVEQLRIVDPINLEGKSTNEWLPEGGWDTEWPDLPFIGYMDPQWTGVAWAPRSAALAKRPFYVVECIPKDRYYLYGKLHLYIDAISFQGSWIRKFDWKGELVHSYQVMAYNPQALTRPNGEIDYVQGSNMAYQTAENLKFNRATVTGVKSTPDSKFHARIVFDDQQFNVDALTRYGK